ncbi:hypothetical protein CEXT_74261 [Caerostris extrusa]|uniref:Uncharacterized protein n=1 Tax=Caerostris extrusa TaxID=172846 RepID=A0AAV4SID3_CAEEX|nr:hypothetical protein CEXT_74261 [Caerostris extrusa]
MPSYQAEPHYRYGEQVQLSPASFVKNKKEILEATVVDVHLVGVLVNIKENHVLSKIGVGIVSKDVCRMSSPGLHNGLIPRPVFSPIFYLSKALLSSAAALVAASAYAPSSAQVSVLPLAH